MSPSAARSRTPWSAGKLRGVVCTSSLDLGVDWGDVDLVINVGAPKGSSRLMQRIGRANHRLDEASRAVLVPANRFEVLECSVAIDAIAENAQDTPPLAHRRARRAGAACARLRLRRAVSLATTSIARCARAAPYADAAARAISTTSSISSPPAVTRSRPMSASPASSRTSEGRWRVANPKVRQSYRHECRHHRRGRHAEGASGAIARRRAGLDRRDRARRPAARRDRGSFHRGARAPRDTFVFGGEVVRYEALVEDQVYVSRAARQGPEGAVLYGWQVSALDLSRRARAPPAR